MSAGLELAVTNRPAHTSLDDGYFGFERHGASIRKAVLLPQAPPPDVLELLGHLGLGTAWQVSPENFEEWYPPESAAR